MGVAVGPDRRCSFTCRLEFFNVFSRDLGGPNTNPAEGTFGQTISCGGGARIGLQGVRLTF